MLTLLYSSYSSVASQHILYKYLGLVQPLSELSLEVYSKKLSSNMASKIVIMDPVLEKAVCLHHSGTKHTMN